MTNSERAWMRMTIQNAIIIVCAVANILHDEGIVDMSRVENLLNIAMWGSIFLVFGAVFYEYDADRKAKQTKRTEHERIDRLIESDVLEETEMDYPPVYSHMIGGKR
jgi:hypothetical protein